MVASLGLGPTASATPCPSTSGSDWASLAYKNGTSGRIDFSVNLEIFTNETNVLPTTAGLTEAESAEGALGFHYGGVAPAFDPATVTHVCFTPVFDFDVHVSREPEGSSVWDLTFLSDTHVGTQRVQWLTERAGASNASWRLHDPRFFDWAQLLVEYSADPGAFPEPIPSIVGTCNRMHSDSGYFDQVCADTATTYWADYNLEAGQPVASTMAIDGPHNVNTPSTDGSAWTCYPNSWIVMLQRETSGGWEMLDVLAHEVGHALGIVGHADATGAAFVGIMDIPAPGDVISYREVAALVGRTAGDRDCELTADAPFSFYTTTLDPADCSPFKITLEASAALTGEYWDPTATGAYEVDWTMKGDIASASAVYAEVPGVGEECCDDDPGSGGEGGGGGGSACSWDSTHEVWLMPCDVRTWEGSPHTEGTDEVSDYPLDGWFECDPYGFAEQYYFSGLEALDVEPVDLQVGRRAIAAGAVSAAIVFVGAIAAPAVASSQTAAPQQVVLRAKHR